MVLEEVKSPGYPKIGPAPLQGHSLSNFKGQRTPRPQSGQGSPSLSRKGWLALLVERHFASPRFCPLLSQGVRDLTLAGGQWERQVALGLAGVGFFGSLRSAYSRRFVFFFFLPSR